MAAFVPSSCLHLIATTGHLLPKFINCSIFSREGVDPSEHLHGSLCNLLWSSYYTSYNLVFSHVLV